MMANQIIALPRDPDIEAFMLINYRALNSFLHKFTLMWTTRSVEVGRVDFAREVWLENLMYLRDEEGEPPWPAKAKHEEAKKKNERNKHAKLRSLINPRADLWNALVSNRRAISHYVNRLSRKLYFFLSAVISQRICLWFSLKKQL